MEARQSRWGLMTLLRRPDDVGWRPDAGRWPVPVRGHRGHARTSSRARSRSIALIGTTAVAAGPALAAGPAVSISVTSSPNPVSSGQALAYTITVANTGGATASGLSLTDSLVGLGIGSFPSSPWIDHEHGQLQLRQPDRHVQRGDPGGRTGLVGHDHGAGHGRGGRIGLQHGHRHRDRVVDTVQRVGDGYHAGQPDPSARLHPDEARRDRSRSPSSSPSPRTATSMSASRRGSS